MGTASKIGWFLAFVVLVGIVWTGVRVRNTWVENDRKFAEALKHRQPRPGEAGAEMKASMEDIKRSMPTPDPAMERRLQVLNTAAPGSSTAFEIMLDPSKVKALPPDQRGPALQTLFSVLSTGERNDKVMAIEALSQIGDTRAIIPLCRAADGQDAVVSRYANRALESMGYRR